MTPDVLQRVLVHVEAHLDEDLSLDAVATLAGRSRFHVARELTLALGEPLKRYVNRLRLERAAVRLLVHDASILDVALDAGFASHEVFTRAFRRHFGCSPTALRAHGVPPARRVPRPAAAEAWEISTTKLVRLAAFDIAFLRHTGPYESVPDAMFRELEAWSERRRLAHPRVFVGVGHDAPGITEPAKLRFDAGVVVVGTCSFGRGRIARRTVLGGEFALTTFAGPYASLPAAYPSIFAASARIPKRRLVGVPVIEIYRAPSVVVDARSAVTDIYLSLAPS
jgi:AraC family transcriptional regulator